MLLKRGKNSIFQFLPINIRNKEGRYVPVVYALRRILNTDKSEYFVYLMKAEIIYFVSRGYKNLSFYENLRINGFKTDAPYNAVYSR